MRKEEKIRYARQIAVPEIGTIGQEKICEGKVLVIGCGALGSMVAMQLAGAGVGKIGIADFDTIDISNLQRQFFFNETDTGLPKVKVLSEKIKKLNKSVDVQELPMLITASKAKEIIPDYDIVIDATDNPESKRNTGEISAKCGKVCVIGGVRDFEGQIVTLAPDSGRFEDYFGITEAGGFTPCSIGGVVGPAAALCASIQASEALKYLVSAGKLLTGEILTFNLLTNTFHKFIL